MSWCKWYIYFLIIETKIGDQGLDILRNHFSLLITACVNGRRVLNLYNIGITDDSCELIANILPNLNIDELNLCINSITSRGLQHLFRSIVNSSVDTLKLDCNNLENDSAELLYRLSNINRITEISIFENMIDERITDYLFNRTQGKIFA